MSTLILLQNKINCVSNTLARQKSVKNTMDFVFAKVINISKDYWEICVIIAEGPVKMTEIFKNIFGHTQMKHVFFQSVNGFLISILC